MQFNYNNDNSYDLKTNMKHNSSLFNLQTENLPFYSTMQSTDETLPKDPQRFPSFSSSESKANSSDQNQEDQSTCQTNQIIPFLNNQMKQEQKKDSFCNKRTFESIFIQTLMKERFSQQTKFYLSADQVVDIDYLKLLARNQEDAYVEDANKVSLFSGFKFINQVVHRMDTKFIEIFLEDISRPLQNVDQIVQLLLSLGDITLKQMADKLQVFWDNIQNTMLTIRSISNNEDFKMHRMQREAASDNYFEEVVSKIDQDQLIQYIYFKIDYENCTLYNSRTGYSPRLYELAAGNAYVFKENLSKNGYYDPIFIKHRLNKCLENQIKFSQAQQTNQKQPKQQPPPPPPAQINTIRTLDGFLIPSFITRKIINLNAPYDTLNQLSFKANNFILINTFELSKEEDVESQLRDIRSGKIYGEVVNSELEGNEDQLRKQFESEQFLLKYYQDDINTLEKKGNKWFKQCGVADIPQKKRKQEQS